MIASRLLRTSGLTPYTPFSLSPCVRTFLRHKRYEAYESRFDPDELAEARAWHQQLDASQLPRGSTTYARSSGPGGQNVNKTETKAVTAFPAKELLSMLPKFLQPGIRASRFYTASNDSLTFHAQSHRSRTANADENRTKLMDELLRLYRDNVPAETSIEKRKKHEKIEKRFHETRIKQKRLASSKKQSRRGLSD
ncbi:hypothetical protein CDD80_158 [Ophiocordyceps camponoti-rufipedis]|uniref:Prokaryotic-type class I peptide chain release factors domain-containing protein n=1 Tax=Ophiocordyceps camponoti-rufipedis TaxID=2004952 RepID=A0A2C5ZDH0_9HYPO|nr:hypothetical protein CDD80_158 [Ophiocordyceps camponoti-rufipedis]